jgi:alkanesulfonate monooxygenase SsuD/methylene tetrahydromethanopterin reductase-like flavin-dependent oxidoreductase (luciferase family)
VTTPGPHGALIPRPARARVPLLIGANGDRMLRLTAEHGRARSPHDGIPTRRRLPRDPMIT